MTGVTVADLRVGDVTLVDAAVWSGPLYPQARERAQRQLCLARSGLHAVSAGLAAADHRPELSACSHCPDQARRYAGAVLNAGDAEQEAFAASTATWCAPQPAMSSECGNSRLGPVDARCRHRRVARRGPGTGRCHGRARRRR